MQAKRFLFLHIFKLLLTELSLKQLLSIYRDLRNYSCGPHNLPITWQTKGPSRMESGTQNSYTATWSTKQVRFSCNWGRRTTCFPQPTELYNRTLKRSQIVPSLHSGSVIHSQISPALSLYRLHFFCWLLLAKYLRPNFQCTSFPPFFPFEIPCWLFKPCNFIIYLN